MAGAFSWVVADQILPPQVQFESEFFLGYLEKFPRNDWEISSMKCEMLWNRKIGFISLSFWALPPNFHQHFLTHSYAFHQLFTRCFDNQKVAKTAKLHQKYQIWSKMEIWIKDGKNSSKVQFESEFLNRKRKKNLWEEKLGNSLIMSNSQLSSTFFSGTCFDAKSDVFLKVRSKSHSLHLNQKTNEFFFVLLC